MARILCKCGYCGTEWIDEHEAYSWKSSARTCSKCGDTKSVSFKPLPKEAGDVFGYRFSPDFPRKHNPYQD